MEAKLAGGKMASAKNGSFLRDFKLECSLPMSYAVADVSHVAMFSNFDGTHVSDNLRFGSSEVMDV